MNPLRTPSAPLRLSRQEVARARAARVLVGFDGFVDQIVTPVARRRGPGDDYVPFTSVAAFAERVGAARGGRNANVELVPRLEKLGGNGPILAHAMLTLGSQVRYVGALGRPEVHPLFVDFARATQAVSLADPGRTTALEFSDGKVMLGTAQSLDRVTYAALVDTLGEEGLQRTIAQADALAFVDWTMVPGATGILQGILEEILPQVAPSRGRLFFFDLADPAKREPAELRAVLEVMASYARFGRVNLGLNRNEARQAAAVTGGSPDEDAPLEAFATTLQGRLALEAVVVHTRDRAVCAGVNGETAAVKVPPCPQPRVHTGAGDHFNAGYLFGRNAGLAPARALRVGVAVASAYVGGGVSPTARVRPHPTTAAVTDSR